MVKRPVYLRNLDIRLHVKANEAVPPAYSFDFCLHETAAELVVLIFLFCVTADILNSSSPADSEKAQDAESEGRKYPFVSEKRARTVYSGFPLFSMQPGRKLSPAAPNEILAEIYLSAYCVPSVYLMSVYSCRVFLSYLRCTRHDAPAVSAGSRGDIKRHVYCGVICSWFRVVSVVLLVHRISFPSAANPAISNEKCPNDSLFSLRNVYRIPEYGCS